VVLLAAMLNFLIGSFIPPDPMQISQGYVGWNSKFEKEYN
jgi:hypothetical protein